jgi:hypothetical protein
MQGDTTLICLALLYAFKYKYTLYTVIESASNSVWLKHYIKTHRLQHTIIKVVSHKSELNGKPATYEAKVTKLDEGGGGGEKLKD